MNSQQSLTANNHRPTTLWFLLPLLTYILGYGALRLSGQALVFQYGDGNRELWSNIDRISYVGPALQAMYLPLISAECAVRHLEWSP
jgi:hypothetical protein